MPEGPNVFERLREAVCAVPPGRVATYGQVAKQVLGATPRMVGFALAGLPEDTDVPWHRIINAAGRISLPADSPGHREQRRRLRAEGALTDESERVDLAARGWFA